MKLGDLSRKLGWVLIDVSDALRWAGRKLTDPPRYGFHEQSNAEIDGPLDGRGTP